MSKKITQEEQSKNVRVTRAVTATAAEAYTAPTEPTSLANIVTSASQMTEESVLPSVTPQRPVPIHLSQQEQLTAVTIPSGPVPQAVEEQRTAVIATPATPVSDTRLEETSYVGPEVFRDFQIPDNV